MTKVNVEQAKARLGELVDAALKGETVVLSQNGQAKVQLVPIETIKPHPRFGSARGMVTLSKDFDEPLDDFKPFTQ